MREDEYADLSKPILCSCPYVFKHVDACWLAMDCLPKGKICRRDVQLELCDESEA